MQQHVADFIREHQIEAEVEREGTIAEEGFRPFDAVRARPHADARERMPALPARSFKTTDGDFGKLP